MKLTVALALVAGLAALVAPPARGLDQPYTETIPGSDVTLEMVPVPGGTFLLGSPEDEADRAPDEGPAVEVKVAPFWMSKFEVTWDLYDAFRNTGRSDSGRDLETDTPADVDAVTRPTKRYGDESFGFGKGSQPVVGISYHSAMEFARWLSSVTGKAYRLPTEAEWEYACQAGTTTAYSFGDDPAALEEHGWYADNSDFQPHPVGQKEANPWGLHDLHGNVMEFCLDRYDAEAYAAIESGAVGPVVLPTGAALPPRGAGRVLGRRPAGSALQRAVPVVAELEQAGSPAAQGHLVAHRRPLRRLPRRPGARGGRAPRRGPFPDHPRESLELSDHDG